MAFALRSDRTAKPYSPNERKVFDAINEAGSSGITAGAISLKVFGVDNSVKHQQTLATIRKLSTKMELNAEKCIIEKTAHGGPYPAVFSLSKVEK